MVSLISCGIINKNIIILVIGGISRFFSKLTLYLTNCQFNKNPIIVGITVGLGKCLAIFPYIFVKIRSRRLNIKNNIYEKHLIIVDSKAKYYKKIRCQKYSLILLSSFLDFFQKADSYIFSAYLLNSFWMLDILFLSIFSFLILKTRLYIFHYLCLIIIIFLSIILIIIELYHNEKIELQHILSALFVEIIYSLIMVINKYSMEYKFCLPYEICFYEGFFSLIGNIIILIIYIKNNINFISKEENNSGDNDLKYILKNINSFEIFIFILSIFLRFIYNLFAILTVKYFTPSYIVIYIVIGEIIFTFLNIRDWVIAIITILIFLITLFLILVYTEIIELNFCSLQKNTRRNIIERATSDLIESQIYIRNNDLNDITDDSDDEEEGK